MSLTIFDIIDRFAFLHGMTGAIVLLLAAWVAVAAWDMRVAVPALGVQYLVLGMLFIDLLDPRLAVVYVIIGVVVTLILLVTAWQVNWGRPPAGLSPAESAALGLEPVRQVGPLALTRWRVVRAGLGVAALAAAVWLARGQGLSLPLLPADLPYLQVAVLGLAGLGLVGLTTSTEPLPAGTGLLLFLSGFSLYYSAADQSIAAVVALSALQLAVSLAIAYLAQARYLPADVLDSDRPRA